VRGVTLRKWEERVDHLLVLTPKDLKSSLELSNHIIDSPLLRDWVAGHTDDAATSTKFLSFCWYM
jgi:hypothetical protein